MTTNGEGSVLIAFDGSDFAKAAVRTAGEQPGPGRHVINLTVFEPLEKTPFFDVAGDEPGELRFRPTPTGLRRDAGC